MKTIFFCYNYYIPECLAGGSFIFIINKFDMNKGIVFLKKLIIT